MICSTKNNNKTYWQLGNKLINKVQSCNVEFDEIIDKNIIQ